MLDLPSGISVHCICTFCKSWLTWDTRSFEWDSFNSFHHYLQHYFLFGFFLQILSLTRTDAIHLVSPDWYERNDSDSERCRAAVVVRDASLRRPRWNCMQRYSMQRENLTRWETCHFDSTIMGVCVHSWWFVHAASDRCGRLLAKNCERHLRIDLWLTDLSSSVGPFSSKRSQAITEQISTVFRETLRRFVPALCLHLLCGLERHSSKVYTSSLSLSLKSRLDEASPSISSDAWFCPVLCTCQSRSKRSICLVFCVSFQWADHFSFACSIRDLMSVHILSRRPMSLINRAWCCPNKRVYVKRTVQANVYVSSVPIKQACACRAYCPNKGVHVKRTQIMHCILPNPHSFSGQVKLTRQAWDMANEFPVEGSQPLVPFRAGEAIQWKAEPVWEVH